MKELTDTIYFQIGFWIVAILFSIFYSIKAFEIHKVTRSKDDKSFLFHQYWLNFLGSLVGWTILWIVLPNLVSGIEHKCTNYISVKEIFLLIGAFLGITGHLPMALVGLALSFRTLVDKFIK